MPKYRPFYIWSFPMLTPTRLRLLECLWALEWLGIHATKIFKNLVDKTKYDKTTYRTWHLTFKVFTDISGPRIFGIFQLCQSDPMRTQLFTRWQFKFH